jgi:hypothetical protein
LLFADLGDVLWSLLIIFFMIIYFMMLFQVIFDVFRRRDASGFKKAVWLVFLLLAPLVGLLAYLIVNADDMARRNIRDVEASQQAFDERVREVAGGGASAEIAKAKDLLDSGAISQAEYDQLKAKALGA